MATNKLLSSKSLSPLPLPLRACSHCIRHHRRSLKSTTTTTSLRFASSSSSSSSSSAQAKNPLRIAENARSKQQEIDRYRRSLLISAAGMAVCAAGMYGVIKADIFGVSPPQPTAEKQGQNNTQQPDDSWKAIRLDAPPSSFPDSADGPSVLRIKGQEHDLHQVPTGTSSVPYFPTTIALPASLQPEATASNLKPGDAVYPTTSASDGKQEEYQLLGLGIRTVSFLRIQVYVVGLYVAKSDIAELQKHLVRTAIHPPAGSGNAGTGAGGVANNTASYAADAATSLVSTERKQLKDILLDPDRGTEAWDEILKKSNNTQADGGIRTAIRIVPTRNTDFMHLRDGWVRGITGRATASRKAFIPPTPTEDGIPSVPVSEFDDDSFGTALNDFKAVFGGGLRKSVPKGQELLLLRNAQGVFDALYQPDSEGPLRWMGRVYDERISRLVWLNYLAGKNVASEGARQSVVDGVMEIVERPAGTITQKVL